MERITPTRPALICDDSITGVLWEAVDWTEQVVFLNWDQDETCVEYKALDGSYRRYVCASQTAKKYTQGEWILD